MPAPLGGEAAGEQTRGPVYIGGLDRSGKTTMHAFLTSHPNIAIPAVGSNMWTYFYGRYGDLARPANLQACLDAMFRYKHVVFLQPDRDRIEREFRAGEPTYARLFSLFLIHFAEEQGKPRWGAQTGLIERYAEDLFGAYPGLKVVHMLRDPRDRYQASIEKWPRGKGRAGGAVARWNYSLRLAERHLSRHPDDYLVVRFEDLVHRPDETVRRVCEFLGEEFAPSMLEMAGAPTHRRRMMGETPGPVRLSPEYIGRFRGRVPPGEIEYIQRHAALGMARYGYEKAPLDMTMRERLGYHLIESPSQTLRRWAWRSVEEGQQRLPRLVPRRPGARMIVEAPNG
ncbi:MAG: sulfotransferase family protein [Actinomycetota bacterium]